MMWNTKSLFAALAWTNIHAHTHERRTKEKSSKEKWHARQFANIIKIKYFFQTIPNHAIQFMLIRWLWPLFDFRQFFRQHLISNEPPVYIMITHLIDFYCYYRAHVCVAAHSVTEFQTNWQRSYFYLILLNLHLQMPTHKLENKLERIPLCATFSF